MHGFDEFFGNLYHLNAEEEPEYADYPKDPNFKKKFGPRGVLKCKATDKDDATVDPVFGKVGKQTIENTGPLTKKRMETVDEEFIGSALDFMERKTKERVPWLCYFNPTRMHVFTHLKSASVGKTGHGLYPDGMVELDGYVGQLLKKVDDLGVADNTIVVFTTDNGAEVLSWPDGGATPFRGEKDTNWEGGWRVPCVMRWPGVIKPGEVINEIGSLTDFLPTFAAAAGEPDIVAKLKKGHKIGDTTKTTTSLLAVALLSLFAAGWARAQEKPVVQLPQPGVPEILAMEAKFVRAAYNNEGYVILGYQASNRSIGEPWMLLEVGITLRENTPDFRMTREALSLETPDGKTIPLPTVSEQREGNPQAIQQRAKVQRDSINYFPPKASRACAILFFPELGSRALPQDLVDLTDDRACVGRLYFKIPGGMAYGQHFLNVKFQKSLVRVPFRMLTKEEEQFLSKNYKSIEKQVEEAFKPKKK